MSVRIVVAWCCLASLLAACTSGSSTTPGLMPSFSTTSNASIDQSPQTHAAKATLVLLVRIPTPRAGHYVSVSTKGMTVLFKGPTQLRKAVALTPRSKGCVGTAAAYECTVILTLRPGKYTGTISMYDRAPVSGRIPAGAKLLSSVQNLPFKILPNVVNRAKFAMAGVVAKIAMSGLPSGAIGTAFRSPQPLAITAADADGYTIVGKYANAITLSNSDASGATTFATSGADHPPAGQLVSSSDTATLNYNGTGIASATIGAAAGGATGASATFTPVPVLASISNTTGPIGESVNETLIGHFAAGATTINVSGSGVTLSNVTAATATSISATFTTDIEAATGPRSVTVQVTGGGASLPQSFSITNAGIDVVTLDTDAGGPGDLRYAMLNAHVGDTIFFDTKAMCGGASCKITLSGPLPPIAQNQTIDGGTFGNVTIDGNGLYRAFWAQSGTVTIANLQIQNVTAKGGGGAGGTNVIGGGGGAGLGAGLFIDAATVNVVNSYFLNDAAVGGNGGGISGTPTQGGGGGGLGGAGGAGSSTLFGGGGGGGGITGAGAIGTTAAGGNGGSGFTATGGAGGLYNSADAGNPGGPGGYGGGGGGAGTGCNCGSGTTIGNGGSGGFGGGGGGAASDVGGNPAIVGGSGGFGGGGGGTASSPLHGSGGNGGPGGGGGSTLGLGGLLGGSVTGGNGDVNGNGGGGAAAGPAIFVNAGGLTTTNSGATGASVTVGAAGGGSATAGTADATPVFNYAGTVNGVSVTAGTGGPVATALGSSAPSRRRLSHARRKP